MRTQEQTTTTLRSLDELRGYRLDADDAELGRVEDVLFLDSDWSIRYFVANTSALFGRKVLLFTGTVGTPNWQTKTVPVNLTKEQIKNSPTIAFDKPVSQQKMGTLHRHYRWPEPWLAAPEAGWTMGAVRYDHSEKKGDPHLRSAREVTGYSIQATDGPIGHVEDFIAEAENWAVRYVVIDTKNWLPGRKVLISPAWIDRVDWANRSVHVGMTREEIEKSPQFDPSEPINREYEERLYDFYGRPAYWT